MSKINTGWTHILSTYGLMADIEANGFTRVSTKDLNAWFPDVDARLMVKFDRLEDRPAVFQEHGLSLWPERNGSFVLMKSEAPYIKIDPKKVNQIRVQYLNARDLGFDLKTLDFAKIKTESQALAVLKYSRIMNIIHSAKGDRVALTDGGRNRLTVSTMTVTFPTPKGRVSIPCAGVQMEPDAVHESDYMITATEAKIIRDKKGLDSLTSLHARQIAFPHSQLEGLVATQNSDKRVTTGILYAWKKDERNPWDFVWLPIDVSLENTTTFTVAWDRAVRFVLVEHPVEKVNKYGTTQTRSDLALVETGRPESAAAFPQFNRLNVIEHIAYDLGRIGASRIIDDLPMRTYRQWHEGKTFTLSKRQESQVVTVDIDDMLAKFSHKLNWGPRNKAYLINDLKWLGLISDYDPATNHATPSTLCMMMASVDHDIRTQRLWNLMMSSPIIAALAKGTRITQDMRKAEGLENDATFNRRVQTARRWIKDVRSRMAMTPDVSYVEYAD